MTPELHGCLKQSIFLPLFSCFIQWVYLAVFLCPGSVIITLNIRDGGPPMHKQRKYMFMYTGIRSQKNIRRMYRAMEVEEGNLSLKRELKIRKV